MTHHWDPELLAGFFEEAREDLGGLEPRLVALRTQPDDASIVHQAFRTVHSIKGNAGFFGIKNVNAFADRFENLLDHLRGHPADVTSSVVDLLLRGVDQIQDMLAAVQNSGVTATDLAPEQQAILDEIPALTTASRVEIPLKLIRKLDELVHSVAYAAATEECALLADLGALVRAVCTSSGKPAAEHAAPQPVSTLCCRWNGTDVTTAVRATDAWLLACAEGQAQPLPADALASLQAVASPTDAASEPFESFRELAELLWARELNADPMLVSDLRAHFDRFLANLTTTPVAPSAPAAGGTALSSPPKPAAAAHEPADHQTTVRVAQTKIDDLLASVGKLILTLKNYSVLEDRLENVAGAESVAQQLTNVNLQFDEVLHALQGDALALRRVPSDTLLRTIPRMCTELANRLNKQVAVEIVGGEVEADRSALELLKDPLTHILRNSLDHGLELPERRRAAGKPECGTVRVRASVDKQFYTLVVEDDGAGIDAERVRAKAVEAGICSAAQADALDEREVLKLIFAPGLSTAARQTDVSGRGVGMDVVLRKVTEAGGKVDVASEPGRGTTLTLQVPLSSTLMVTHALHVVVAGGSWFIPNAFVQTVQRGDRGRIRRSLDGRELVVVNETLQNLVRASAVLGYHSCGSGAGDAFWIMLRQGRRSLCLEVDGVRGIEEIVLSELADLFRGVECAQGAAFTREGEIALVLNAGWLLGSAAPPADEPALATAEAAP